MGEVEIVSIGVENNLEDSRGKCWQDSLSNQFPVINYENVGGISVFQVGAPHEGYTIETQLVNNKMNGKSKIISVVGKWRIKRENYFGPFSAIFIPGLLFSTWSPF